MLLCFSSREQYKLQSSFFECFKFGKRQKKNNRIFEGHFTFPLCHRAIVVVVGHVEILMKSNQFCITNTSLYEALGLNIQFIAERMSLLLEATEGARGLEMVVSTLETTISTRRNLEARLKRRAAPFLRALTSKLRMAHRQLCFPL